MEFRQVVSVCRSAAAATRPSLTSSTRPPPSSILLRQRHFTTNTKQQSEAAAAVAEQPQAPATRYDRVAQLQHELSRSSSRDTPPPPRPPFRKSDILDTAKRPPPVWAIPQNTNTNTTTTGGGRSPLLRNTMLTGRAPTTSNASGLYNLPHQITSDMEQSLGTTPHASPGTGTMSTWNEEAFLAKNYDVSEPELRLRPSTGRTVDIKGNVDLARGFRLLQRAVAQNRVKTDVRLSKFYERPALKRKRQKRERWQVRFKEGFKAAIWRAMELKGQGW